MNWLKRMLGIVEHDYEVLVADMHAAVDRVRSFVAGAHGEADALIAQAAKMKAEANAKLASAKAEAQSVWQKVDDLEAFLKSPTA